ncbi:oxalate decarboxylase [Trametes sanguinea]|nr:oxalate decarboxylase [Trametes sanguinea]
MNKLAAAVFCAVIYSRIGTAVPVSDVEAISSLSSLLSATLAMSGGEAATTATGDVALPSPTVPYASDDPNYWLWNETTTDDPEPIRGSLGGSILGPQNVAIDKQNPDLLAPPTTDNGDVGNAKWPFGLSKNRLVSGGWIRTQNVEQMPLAKGKYSMAGANIRLEPGAIRELHWHNVAEWAYVLEGSTQITSVDQLGRNYVATVNKGDLWYFPPGIPHSLQATNDSASGTEFLLIFPSGTFGDDNTFLLTDWLAHTPKEVIAKNFQDSIEDWNQISSRDLYIFPGVALPSDQKPPADPNGQIPQPFSFAFSKVKPTQYSGGTVKIADSTTFPISTEIAVSEVTVEPGAMRAMHWHPTQDEWGLFLEGTARATIFAASGNAQTFDYQPGDISYVPTGWAGHYIENTGNTTLRFLEIFNTDRFEDVSLEQWLALTPPALVKQHLQLSDSTIAKFNKMKNYVVGPDKSQ